MTKPFVLAALALSLAGTAGLASAEVATYKVDPTHTFVFFEATHFGTSTNRGRFDKKDGSVTLDLAAKTGSAEITIDMASVNTGVGPFDGHLKKPDFFDVAKHPTATFKADNFSFDGDKVSAVQGSLTFLGQTHPVTLKADRFNCYDNPMLKRQVCGGDFETTIQRSQYGSTYGLPGIPDDIKLIIQIEAVKQ